MLHTVMRTFLTAFILLVLSFNATAFQERPLILAESKFSDLAKQLGLGGNNSNSEPLQPNDAFKYDLTVVNEDKLVAFWKVVPGHYLYKDKIIFTATSPDNVRLGEIAYSKAKLKKDPLFGDILVYEQDFELTLPISDVNGSVTIETEYQGCSEITGICYPPQKVSHTLLVNAPNNPDVASNATATTKKLADKTAKKTPPPSPPKTPDSNPSPEQIKPATEPATNDKNITDTTTDTTQSKNDINDIELPQSEHDSVLEKLNNASDLGAFFLILVGGILLAFTPCIYPMVPILSSIIVGHGHKVSTKKAFTLSLAYVLPMAFIYAIAGYFIGLGGENLQVIFQKPWVIISFSVVFVLLALSMFGFYDLQMPQSIQSKLTNISNNQEGGTLIGAAIMGALSALIVGPCVTGPLMAAFTFIANKGSAFWGALYMFGLGIGIGLPLLILGTSAGTLLPRAGAWMEATKAIFGVVMLGMAIWMLERILPSDIVMALTGILLVTSGIYMGALSTPPEHSSRWRFLWKGLGLVGIIYGALMLTGASLGNHYVFQPLRGTFDTLQTTQISATTASGGTAVATPTFKKFKGLDGLQKELDIAKAQNKHVMVDFYADWCVYCKTLEKEIFPHPKVASALSDYILLKTDITAMDKKDSALLKHFKLLAPPILLFFSPDGKEQKKFRLYGNTGVDKLSKHAKLFSTTR